MNLIKFHKSKIHGLNKINTFYKDMKGHERYEKIKMKYDRLFEQYLRKRFMIYRVTIGKEDLRNEGNYIRFKNELLYFCEEIWRWLLIATRWL